MNHETPEAFMSGLLGALSTEQLPIRGAKDTDDDRDDEHAGENEASIRELDENTEAPEEFSVDDEDEPPQTEEVTPGEDE
jgi:hypothetical protein